MTSLRPAALPGGISAAMSVPGGAIPFAHASTVAMGSLAWAIVVTLALLVAIATGLWLVRRNGWLNPWLGARAADSQVDGVKVITRARLGPTSRVTVFEYAGSRFLTVESSQHLVFQPLASCREEDDAHDA